MSTCPGKTTAPPTPTDEMPIGTRVVIAATPRRLRAVVYLKVDHDVWQVERFHRAEPHHDRQVQWWLDHRPEKTTVEAPLGIELWGQP